MGKQTHRQRLNLAANVLHCGKGVRRKARCDVGLSVDDEAHRERRGVPLLQQLFEGRERDDTGKTLLGRTGCVCRGRFNVYEVCLAGGLEAVQNLQHGSTCMSMHAKRSRYIVRGIRLHMQERSNGSKDANHRTVQ